MDSNELFARLKWAVQFIETYAREASGPATPELNKCRAAIADHPASQSQAAPVRPTDDDLWDATLRDRDAYHDWADKLAGAIAKHFGADIGEHSNMSLPWSEALDVIEQAAPVAKAVPSTITDGDSARSFVAAWHREHFPTDRTFTNYIMGRNRHCALAGDFAWQLAKALEALAAPTPQEVSQPVTLDAEPKKIVITLRQAHRLVEFFGGHDASVTVMPPAADWEQQAPGLYAYCTEYPEDGSTYLGPTETDDELMRLGVRRVRAQQMVRGAKTWKDAPYKLDHVAEAWARGWNEACATLADPVAPAVSQPNPDGVQANDLGEDRIDNALANFLAEHTNLNQDGIDTHAMTVAIAINYAALKPVDESDIEEWHEQGYLAPTTSTVSATSSTSDSAPAAADEVRDAALEEAAEKLDAMNDSAGDRAAYENRDMLCCESERMWALTHAAEAIRALRTDPSTGADGSKAGA